MISSGQLGLSTAGVRCLGEARILGVVARVLDDAGTDEPISSLGEWLAETSRNESAVT